MAHPRPKLGFVTPPPPTPRDLIKILISDVAKWSHVENNDQDIPDKAAIPIGTGAEKYSVNKENIFYEKRVIDKSTR